MTDAPLIRAVSSRRVAAFDRSPSDEADLAGLLRQAPARVRTVALVLFLLTVAFLARFQTFGNPVLEFDEQFYRFVGERMLDGAVPFVDIWDRKPVGLFLIYAGAAALLGTTPLAYQAVALLFVVATAWVMHGMAQRLSRNRFTPVAVAVLYILWLNLLEGEGGQSPVFYLLPVCLAASLVLKCFAQPWSDERTLMRRGWAVALLIGLAAQIKYTVVLEGGYFLLAMLWQLRRAGMSHARLATCAIGWGVAVLAPTMLAGLVYAGMGHWQEWWFANFESVMLRTGRQVDPVDFAGAFGTMLPLLLTLAWGLSRLTRFRTQVRFVIGWALMSALALVALWSFAQHYWMPLLPPLLLLCVMAFDRARPLAAALIVAAGIAGQAVVAHSIWLHGDGRNYDNMVAAMGPGPACIFLFDGFPALNEVSDCTLTRFSFPGHLSAGPEAGALGVDPVKEVRRIMRQHPRFVVRADPVWQFGNRQSHAALMQALRRDYRLIHVERTGRHRLKLIYELKDGLKPAATRGMPSSRRSPDAT
jgi:hypothetical protein